MAPPEVPQIPWAKKTKVTEALPYQVNLEKPGITAEILEDGDIVLVVDSRDAIGDYLHKSPELTKSLRKYLKQKGGYFIDGTIKWLHGETSDPEAEGLIEKNPVFGWWPDFKVMHRSIGKMARFGAGKASDLTSNWIGTDFPYVHFVMGEEGDEEEAIAIDWGDPHGVEVWGGEVPEFIAALNESLDWEIIAHYNEDFENGFLWALDQMEVFTKPYRHNAFRNEVIERKIPDWAVEVIADNPMNVLWPDLVEKLWPIRKRLPKDLEMSLHVWVDARRREREEATGQTRLWPEER